MTLRSATAEKPAGSTDASAVSRLARISTMPRLALAELWSEAFGQPPPKGASTALLRRAVAYRLQEKQFGGVKKRELKALLQFATPNAPATGGNEQQRVPGKQGLATEGDDASPISHVRNATLPTVPPSPSQDAVTAKSSRSTGSLLPPALRPGTRLVRSWQGTTHVVEVVEEGLVWNGKTYRSLSAVALAITGARWSGRRFFRL